ncbi:hypothetical protein [Nonomuraea diastatica]|uniref:hypothetical protein n=1 Tax=Nonomuraea diastatica TaxID=1848329 RepID=UPI0015F2BA1B|nr:hypothetical protein [Nonomuraea diastatica]
MVSEFTVRRLAALRPRIQDIVDHFIDDTLAADRHSTRCSAASPPCGSPHRPSTCRSRTTPSSTAFTNSRSPGEQDMMRIEAGSDFCVGSGQCVLTEPAVFGPVSKGGVGYATRPHLGLMR